MPFSWIGKRVLVTGASGFKGAWLCMLLNQLGANVVGISKDNDHHNGIFNVVRSSAFKQHHKANLEDYSLLREILEKERPEILFHLAAQPLVRASIADPLATFKANITGGYNLLEAIRNTSSIKAAVIITTDKVYYNPENNLQFKETDRLGGSDPYSCSKACLELLLDSYIQTFFQKNNSLAIASARAGNVLGGGDWGTDRLIPDFVRCISERSTLCLRFPNSIRPWQFVLDALRGYLLLAKYLYLNPSSAQTAFNFGPGDDDNTNVRELIEKFSKAFGNGIKIKTASDISVSNEARVLRLNAEKANNILGWRPLLKLDETVEWTGKWYDIFLRDPSEITRVTHSQIHRYIELVSQKNEQL